MARPSLTSLLVITSLVSGVAAACGGNDDSASGSSGTFTPSGGSDSGGQSGSGGNSGSGGSGGSSAGQAGSITAGNAGTAGTTNAQLLVEPAEATITITDKTMPISQVFTAKLGNQTTDVIWSVDNLGLGNIDSTGTFTTSAFLAGEATVTAKFGDTTGTAKLHVKIAISEDIADPNGVPIDPSNHTALEGPAMPDPGLGVDPPTPTKILYPYDGTVMPLGLTAPLLQFSPGNLPPQDAKIELSSSLFSWTGYVHVTDGNRPQFSIPQDIWDAALSSSKSDKVTISVTKASGGVAYGPAQTGVIVAPATLKGAVYYMTYEGDGLGIWSVKPGKADPAEHKISGCAVCHSASSNGTRLAAGAEVGTDFSPNSGIYKIDSNGLFEKMTDAPAGLGGDTRGISYAAFTPDGRYVMRSQNNFWGGPNQLAWRIDDVNNQLVPATVVGLGGDISALIPAISHDGTRYAFTTGDADTQGGGVALATPRRSLNLMDMSIDSTTDTLTFTNRKVLFDNGPTGSVAKFPTFLPDNSQIVFQEGEGYQDGFESMLPTWGPDSTYMTTTGRMMLFDTNTSEKITLARLNAGIADIDANRNYEPFALPIPAGGYFWVVFTSIREYGNKYTNAEGTQRKQVWVAAISVNHALGEDPSHPPFYLPNQTETKNERGFWALEPCRSLGTSCESGDECCNGFCRPEDPNDPNSPKVCQEPPEGQCSEVAEACSITADCCGAASGVICVGGFCTKPEPMIE